MSESSSTAGVVERCYGKYYCGNCHNKWSSVHAWLMYYQTCQRCLGKVEVDGDSLRQLERNSSNERVFGYRKEHKTQQCEKCIELRQLKYAGKCTFFRHTLDRPPRKVFPAGLGLCRENVSYADAAKEDKNKVS